MSQIALNTLAEYVAEAAKASRAPKHVCVLEAFTRCIHSGQFRPGERVPTETELSQRLPVSLGTVQKALSKLADRGLVVRSRKTGTFIADRRSQAPEVRIYRFKDPTTGEVLLPFTRVLGISVDSSTGPWQDTSSAKRFVRVDRLVWAEEDPPAYNSVYVAFKYGRHLLNLPIEELHGSSFHRTLVDRFNLPTLNLEHRLGCRALSDDACAQLTLASGTLGCVWDIKSYSFDRESILFQRFELPPGHRPIEIAEHSTGYE
ncbi:MAG: GntR family transcriptional regulator [Hyphomicrobiaceae bacterium]